MNKMSTNMFIFAAGAAIGSAVAWLYAKKYYERIANEEIESMKEWLARRVEEQDKEKEEEPETPMENPTTPSVKPDLMDYASRLKDLNYTDYSRRTEEKEETDDEEEVDDTDDYIYVIKPEIFGEEDYEEVSLTYYADGVLTDEQDNPIEDVAGMVGADYASHFGEYEDDSVFIRNDRLRTDFEILADQRNYSNLTKNGHLLTEDE